MTSYPASSYPINGLELYHHHLSQLADTQTYQERWTPNHPLNLGENRPYLARFASPIFAFSVGIYTSVASTLGVINLLAHTILKLSLRAAIKGVALGCRMVIEITALPFLGFLGIAKPQAACAIALKINSFFGTLNLIIEYGPYFKEAHLNFVTERILVLIFSMTLGIREPFRGLHNVISYPFIYSYPTGFHPPTLLGSLRSFSRIVEFPCYGILGIFSGTSRDYILRYNPRDDLRVSEGLKT